MKREQYLERVRALQDQGFQFKNQASLAGAMSVSLTTLSVWLDDEIFWREVQTVLAPKAVARRQKGSYKKSKGPQRALVLPTLTMQHLRAMRANPNWDPWKAEARHLGKQWGKETGRRYLACSYRFMTEGTADRRGGGVEMTRKHSDQPPSATCSATGSKEAWLFLAIATVATWRAK
ncbi:MAG: hypothetical protein HC812_20035 [Leptolyngbya sp. RL_3_1]|nr:hypothetical protein [Leptolyngbya sp. RL_3_1]